MATMITPTEHEKFEWSRMAQAAYRANINNIGHMYSAAASTPRNGAIETGRFDVLQAGYREWLIWGRWPIGALDSDGAAIDRAIAGRGLVDGVQS